MEKRFLLKENIKTLVLAVVAVGVMALAGCNKDDPDPDPEPTQTVLEILESNTEYSDFAEFYELYADELPDISGETEFTLFLPNNAAFQTLRETLSVDDLTAIKESEILKVLSFHFISGTKTEISAGDAFTTDQGENITINSDGTIKEGGSNPAVEILSSTEATNGAVHVVNRILIPPTFFAFIVEHLGKISQTIFLGGEFSILADVIAKADTYAESTQGQLTPHTTTLSNADVSLTFFAPSNATFYAAAGVIDGDNAATIAAKVQGFMDNYSGQQFYGIVANHIVTDDGNPDDDNTIINETELETGATFPTAFTVDGENFGSLLVFNNTEVVPADNGIGVYLDSNGDVDLQNPGETLGNLDAEIVFPPSLSGIAPSNGSLYIIAGILVPPSE